MAPSCWCWFPIYFVASVTLGIIAITSAIHSNSKPTPQEIPPQTLTLSTNATQALKNSGFTLMADLLHRSPPFFLPPQNSTFFAIKDSAISNTSLPLWFLKSLLLYHTFTTKLTMQELLNVSQGTCMTTLFRQKNASITKIETLQKTVEINRVSISNPNMFLGEQFIIHGVVAPFSSIQREDLQGGPDFIHSPTCPSSSSLSSSSPSPSSSSSNRSSSNRNSTYTNGDFKKIVEWNRIIQFLGSKGYSSFSIALHSVLEGLLKESVSYHFASVTIFAPPDVNLLSYPSHLLYRAVKIHILPQRLTYKELSLFPVRTLLKTLMPEHHLEIDGVLGFMAGVVINGIEIVKPDMFVSEKFVVHGISRAFKMAESNV
ncbi:fasciclin-like arabinogalactan protein 21 [Vicia villosa]|uniref:fasciclin-like arabinogalactan protein 21 n=1 Tax=Vicia villosa TaxID=3911 RepID=UPI00273B8280|nr:fasciclin-like arabinogalactan protein 21 [Vicia villosa]